MLNDAIHLRPAPPPMVRRFLQRLPLVDRGYWHTMAELRFDHVPDQARLRAALRRVAAHHFADVPLMAGLAGWRDLAPDLVDLASQPFFLRAGALREQAARLAADVARPPRIGDAVLVRVADGDVRLLWMLHQSAADVSSWAILIEDLGAAYASPGAPLRVGAPAGAYAAWASRHARERGPQSRVPRMRIPRETPVGEPPDTGLEYDTRKLTLVMPRRDWQYAQSLIARHAGLDPLAVTLAVLALALRAWTGDPDVAFDVQTAGRGACAEADFSRTVGWLDAYAPLAIRADGGPAAVLERMRAAWLRLQADGPAYVQACNDADGRFGDPLDAGADQPLLVSFLGDLEALALPHGWSVRRIAVRRRAPTNPRTHEIELDAVRNDGVVELQLRYAKSVLSARRARGLQRHIRRAWQLVAAHLRDDTPDARR